MGTKYQVSYYTAVDDEEPDDYSEAFDTLRECVDAAKEVAEATPYARFVVEKQEEIADYRSQITTRWVKT